jgi:hypothetical protein
VKKILTFTMLALMATSAYADFDCKRGDTVCEEKEHALRMANIAKLFTRSIIYTRDARTGLCFAYSSAGHNDERSATMTNVPCEKIPKELLIDAR